MKNLMFRSLVLVVLMLLSMEAAARIEDRVRYGTAWLSPYRDQAELLVRDADGVHARPAARYQKWGINALGFRGPEVDSTAPPGTLRVVTTGASETFGLYEPEGLEYPRQLEDSLNAELHGAGCPSYGRAQVLNAAMPGMSLPTVSQDIRTRIRRLKPDVVVYYPTPPQYLEESVPQPATPDSSGVAATPPWQAGLYPRIVARLREQAKALMPSRLQDYLRVRMIEAEVSEKGEGWRFESPPSERLHAYERGLRELVGGIRAIGAEPVLMTHGNAFVGSELLDPQLLHKWERFYPRATGQAIVSFDEAAAGITRLVASDSGVALVDVHVEAPSAAFEDYAHFNTAGAGQVAGLLSTAVLDAARSHSRCSACPEGC